MQFFLFTAFPAELKIRSVGSKQLQFVTSCLFCRSLGKAITLIRVKNSITCMSNNNKRSQQPLKFFPRVNVKLSVAPLVERVSLEVKCH